MKVKIISVNMKSGIIKVMFFGNFPIHIVFRFADIVFI